MYITEGPLSVMYITDAVGARFFWVFADFSG